MQQILPPNLSSLAILIKEKNPKQPPQKTRNHHNKSL